MRICFNIVEDRDFDPTPAHIIITDEIKPEKLYVVYIPLLPLPPHNLRIRKRLTKGVVKQGIDTGICYLYSLDYVFAGGLRAGIVEEIRKHLKDIQILFN